LVSKIWYGFFGPTVLSWFYPRCISDFSCQDTNRKY